VNRDNTVSFQNLQLQIERVHWRGTLASCNVRVHLHLDGTISLTHAAPAETLQRPRCGPHGDAKRGRQRCGKDARWKSPKSDFPTALGNPAQSVGFPLSASADGYGFMSKT
jgi:hypothetical protein